MQSSPRLREHLASRGMTTDPTLAERGTRTDLAQVLGGAGHIALTEGEHEIRISHLLRALAADPDSDAARLLTDHGIHAAQLGELADGW
jgi:ATP-dependent Clp protease ATP-binding subunit ClpA